MKNTTQLIKTLLFTLLIVGMSHNVMAANKSSQSPLNKDVIKNQITPNTSGAPTQKKKQTVHSDVGIWLYSLNSSVYQDIDRDGFYQNLSLEVDLDTNAAYRDVTIQLWLHHGGRAQHVYTSQSIHLSSDSEADAQKIDIQFLDDIDANYYQLEMVIVDDATHQEVFRVGQYDSAALQDVALESQRYDQDGDVSIYSADIDLYNDANHNGYYHQMTVEFDADISHGSARLIAEFYIDDQLIHTSYPFTVVGTRTSDKQTFDIEMLSGLASGYYDLDIHLIDADSRYRRHHVSALDWVVFNDLPLESAYWNNYQPDHIDVEIEQSGGAIGIMLLLIGIAGLLRHRWQQA